MKIGQAAVPVDKHLSIVESWLDEALDDDGLTDQVIAKVKEKMKSHHYDGETIELEVFSAVIVNHMKDVVFKYRKPSSFP